MMTPLDTPHCILQICMHEPPLSSHVFITTPNVKTCVDTAVCSSRSTCPWLVCVDCFTACNHVLTASRHVPQVSPYTAAWTKVTAEEYEKYGKRAAVRHLAAQDYPTYLKVGGTVCLWLLMTRLMKWRGLELQGFVCGGSGGR